MVENQKHSQDQGKAQEEEEKEFEIDYIVGWKINPERNWKQDESYDRTLRDVRWVLRFQVKWVGYPLEDEYEVLGKEGFAEWLPVYDEQVAEIMAKDQTLEHPDTIQQRCDTLNATIRAEKKLAKKAIKDESNPNSRSNSRSNSRQRVHNSGATRSRSPSLAFAHAPPTRRATRNGQPMFDLSEYLQDQGPSAGLTGLIEERRDGAGRLIDKGLGSRSASVESGGKRYEDDRERVGKRVRRETSGAGRRSSEPKRRKHSKLQSSTLSESARSTPTLANLRFADDDDDEEKVVAPAPRAPIPLALPLFADDDSSEPEDEKLAPAALVDDADHQPLVPVRFADDMSEEDELPAEAAGEPMEVEEPAAMMGGPGLGAVRPVFADASDDEDQVDEPEPELEPRRANVKSEFIESSIASRHSSASISHALPGRKNSITTSRLPPSTSSRHAGSLVPRRVASGSGTSAPRTAGGLPSSTLSKIKSISIPRVSDTPAPIASPSAASPGASTSTSKPSPAPQSPALPPPSHSPSETSTTDPRPPRLRRPSGAPTDSEGSPPLAASIKSGTSEPRAVAPDPNIFNNGLRRPSTVNGQVILNKYVLETKLRKLESSIGQYRDPAGRLTGKAKNLKTTGAATADIFALWDIQNWSEDFVDWKEVMVKRECFIWPLVKEGNAIKSARDRLIERDVTYLQLLLSEIPGVTQAEQLRQSVKAIFVHVTEWEEIGKVGGNLSELEGFRLRADGDTVFVLFGLTEKDAVAVFKKFWHLGTAICFTPKVLFKSPDQVEALLGRLSPFPQSPLQRKFTVWSPVYYCSTEGPFGDKPGLAKMAKLQRDFGKQLKIREAVAAFERALARRQIHLLGRPSRPLSSLELKFPDKSDECFLSIPLKAELDAQLAYFGASSESERERRQTAMLASVGALQDFVVLLRMRYLMMRSWVIVGSEEEVEVAAASQNPGIQVLTVTDANSLVKQL